MIAHNATHYTVMARLADDVAANKPLCSSCYSWIPYLPAELRGRAIELMVRFLKECPANRIGPMQVDMDFVREIPEAKAVLLERLVAAKQARLKKH